MSEFDKMLDDLAREIETQMDSADPPTHRWVPEKLRRLLPLLEAGQAMYYALDGKGNSQVEIEWDAAKQAAMEGR